MSGHYAHWTPAELKLLHQHYPQGGTAAVQQAGVNRSNTAIRRSAVRHNVLYRGKPRAALSPSQRERLHELGQLQGDLLDASRGRSRTLAALTRRGLAKRVAPGLYRITLAGILANQEGQVPGCHDPERADGLCDRKLSRSLLTKTPGDRDTPRGNTILHWPARPKRITDALDKLAERAATEPGWTNERYEAEQKRITREE